MALLAAVLIAGCQISSGTSPVSAIEKRQVEQKVMAYSVDVIYGSTLAVLVDQGYTIQNSDKAGGLIVAEKFGEKRPWGFVAYDRDVFSTSVVISPSSGSNALVRYTVRQKVFTNIGYGEGIKEVKEILDPDVSNAFFTLLKTEAERRSAGFN